MPVAGTLASPGDICEQSADVFLSLGFLHLQIGVGWDVFGLLLAASDIKPSSQKLTQQRKELSQITNAEVGCPRVSGFSSLKDPAKSPRTQMLSSCPFCHFQYVTCWLHSPHGHRMISTAGGMTHRCRMSSSGGFSPVDLFVTAHKHFSNAPAPEYCSHLIGQNWVTCPFLKPDQDNGLDKWFRQIRIFWSWG